MKRITAVLLLAALLIACLNGCGLMLASFEAGEEIMDAVLSALQEQTLPIDYPHLLKILGICIGSSAIGRILS